MSHVSTLVTLPSEASLRLRALVRQMGTVLPLVIFFLSLSTTTATGTARNVFIYVGVHVFKLTSKPKKAKNRKVYN